MKSKEFDITMSEKNLKPGKYRHYKSGDLYEVIGIALHRETFEELVVYKALYDSEEFDKDQIWVRPKKMFVEDVKHNDIIVPRFQFIETIN
jgi:hypothetical protein